MDWLSVTKVTGSQALRSATTGCVFGLAGFGAGKAVGAIASRATSTIARDGAVGAAGVESGGAQIFRAVGPQEAADMGQTGAYRTVPGLEGKYLFPTQGQAGNIAPMFTERGMGGPYTITSGTIAKDVLPRGIPIRNAREGPGYFLQEELLRYITNVTMHRPPG